MKHLVTSLAFFELVYNNILTSMNEKIQSAFKMTPVSPFCDEFDFCPILQLLSRFGKINKIGQKSNSSQKVETGVV
jgi:hypothetical protein